MTGGAVGARYEFRVLGPLEVLRDGEPVRIDATKVRLLLAVLLAEANQVVGVERLVNRLWGERPPDGARNTLQNYVLRLRRLLGCPAGGAPLLTRPHGYVIETEPDALDLHRFTALVRQGRTAFEEGAPERAAPLLREALSLWRGEPLSDLPAHLLQGVAPALDEQRLDALELRIDVDLALGRAARVLPELRGLIEEHPLREHFWAQRMRALFDCGRQGEALESYRTVTALLADELGVAPGEELRRLHHRLLAAAPALDRTRPARPAAPPPRDGELPVDITTFVGREAQLARLRRLLATARVVTLTGVGGVGKTRLALRAAADAAPSFADGVRLADLAPLRDADLLDRAVSEALGLRDQSARPAAEAVAGHLRDRSLLLVLDNCEHLVEPVAALVLRLVRAAPGLRVLATSRQRLGVPGEHVMTVPSLTVPEAEDEVREGEGTQGDGTERDGTKGDGAGKAAYGYGTDRPGAHEEPAYGYGTDRPGAPVRHGTDGQGTGAVPPGAVTGTVGPGDVIGARSPAAPGSAPDGAADDPLLRFEAVKLLVDRAAGSAPAFRLTARNRRAVAQLCRRLDGIPLAIELAAVRLGAMTAEEVLERLDDRFRLLSMPQARTADRYRRTLRGVVDWSHELCTAQERLLWHRLSVFSGGFDLEAAEQVCAGEGVAREDVLDLLAGLVDKSIVVVDSSGDRARYRLLETVRQYGRQRLENEGAAARLRTAHSEFYRLTAVRAGHEWCGPAEVDWLHRLRTELPNIRAALAHCAAEQDRAGAGLEIAVNLARTRCWFFSSTLGEGRHWLERLLPPEPEGPRRLEGPRLPEEPRLPAGPRLPTGPGRPTHPTYRTDPAHPTVPAPRMGPGHPAHRFPGIRAPARRPPNPPSSWARWRRGRGSRCARATTRQPEPSWPSAVPRPAACPTDRPGHPSRTSRGRTPCSCTGTRPASRCSPTHGTVSTRSGSAATPTWRPCCGPWRRPSSATAPPPPTPSPSTAPRPRRAARPGPSPGPSGARASSNCATAHRRRPWPRCGRPWRGSGASVTAGGRSGAWRPSPGRSPPPATAPARPASWVPRTACGRTRGWR